MNRVFSILIIGGLFLATSAISAPHSTISGTVEAAPALGFISGTVRNDSGAPLTGATVALFEAGLNGKLVKSLMTDPQGKFTTGLAPGSYTLRAEAATRWWKSAVIVKITAGSVVACRAASCITTRKKRSLQTPPRRIKLKTV